jgi:crotonobetainyl-CoA:carnitine CoA-transferase CaiB-like acyl-CoA transferase
MLVEQPAGQPHLGLPIKFSDEPGHLNGRLDEPGQSTDQLLHDIGYDDASIAALRQCGAIG